uniref:Loxtox protein n=1 Tax=Loxosceles similis TaxID=321804 RepID=A0A1B2AS99_LOXSM|nr:loxtox protein [Loxosceles similis]
MLLKYLLFLAFGIIISQVAASAPYNATNDLKPIWIMGHMVNAISQIKEFLNLGANSLEFDIAFDSQAKAQYTYHKMPCDCFRVCAKWEYISSYLSEIREVTTPGNPKLSTDLILLILDLKIDWMSGGQSYVAGGDMASKLLDYYWQRKMTSGRAYIVLSIPDIKNYGFIRGFREKLQSEGYFDQYKDKIGYDFSGNEHLSSIRKALQRAGVTEHVWQSDGVSNCFARSTARLKKALRNRDSPGGYINKIYYWTVDKYSTMRKAISLGVDGVMTNHPNRANFVLGEGAFRDKFRPAYYEDIPW